MSLRHAIVALCCAGAVAGCGAGPATSPSGSEASPASRPTQTLTGDKRAAGATLPDEVDGWRLARRTDGAGGAKLHFYARPGDAKTQLIATLTPVALTSEALAKALSGVQTIGPATCGSVAGGATPACYVPLDGGNLSVTAPLPLDQLAAITGHLYAALG